MNRALRRALSLKATLLVSANALSKWNTAQGIRSWKGWNTRPLTNVPIGTRLMLDSGGFTSHMIYGGFPWTIDDYIDLATRYPFHLFASFDYPVEQEIARNRPEIDERIARTISANRETRRRAQDAGIADRFMPVLQGRIPSDYERCAQALAWSMVPGRTIGIGSMCRRHTHGPEGLIAVVEHLDKILPKGITLHCFGVKGSALPYLRQFEDRIASIDSQAYGVSARQDARKRGVSKTDHLVARHMLKWYLRQCQAAKANPKALPPERPRARVQIPSDPWQIAIAKARAEINDLIATGDLEHDEIIEPWIDEWAAELL